MPDTPVRILYEDNHVLVVVKPCNMPTQADSSGDLDLLSCMKDYIGKKYHKPGAVYLGLVHRLDRPVGGLVVFARTSKAAERLSEQVRTKTMNRQYLTVVRGSTPPNGRLVDWLLKDPKTNMVTVVPPGAPMAKEAILSFEKLEEADGCSLLKVQLYTGRSHQIRVQMMHMGHPIWGDARYGKGRPGEQIALFGAFLTFIHPTLKKQMSFAFCPPVRAPYDAFNLPKCPWSDIMDWSQAIEEVNQ